MNNLSENSGTPTIAEHFVLDDWTSPELLRAVLATWPADDSPHWHRYADEYSSKRASRSWEGMPRAATEVLRQMAQLTIGDYLGVSSFPDLDGLNGAGLHYMKPGDQLGLHQDAQAHPLRPWKRVASAVLYLESADGGELNFHDDGGAIVHSIAPAFNRLSLFRTENCWHSVSACRTIRRSVCMFFWTDERCEGTTRATFRG